MRILVDADACPVVTIVEHTAEKYQIPMILLCDTNHVLQSGYSEVLTVGAADVLFLHIVCIKTGYESVWGIQVGISDPI